MKRALSGMLLLPTVLEAQSVPSQLTVDDALRLARANSPAYRQAVNDTDVARAQVRQSYGAFLPSLSASLRFDGSAGRTSTGQGDFGEVIDGEARTIESSTGSHGVSARMTLFDGGAMFQQLAAARAGEDAAHASVAAALIRLDVAVRRSYYHAHQAEHLIALEERLLASARDRLTRTEYLFRVASATRVDVLGAQVDVASQEQALARARDTARKLRLALVETIGLPPRDADAFRLAEPAPQAFDPASLDPEALVARALRTSPLALQQGAIARAAAQRAGAARAQRWPSISADASYRRSLRESGVFDAFGRFGAQQRGFYFGLSAELPLFSNFRTATSIAQAEATSSDAHEEARSVRLQLEREVRAAVIDLENAYRQLELAEQKAMLSSQRLELATEQYRLGALSFLNLQRVIDETSAAERQALEARYTFTTARIALEEKLGAPLPEG